MSHLYLSHVLQKKSHFIRQSEFQKKFGWEIFRLWVSLEEISRQVFLSTSIQYFYKLEPSF